MGSPFPDARPGDQIVGAHAAISASQLIQGLGIIDLGVNDQILDARLLIGMVPGVEVVGLLATGQIQPSPNRASSRQR